MPRVRSSPPSSRCRLGDHYFLACVLARCLPAGRAAAQVRSGVLTSVAHRCRGRAGDSRQVRTWVQAAEVLAGPNLAAFGTAHA
eukprot:9764204-Alexandrium_andersonii.AAC.1